MYTSNYNNVVIDNKIYLNYLILMQPLAFNLAIRIINILILKIVGLNLYNKTYYYYLSITVGM